MILSSSTSCYQATASLQLAESAACAIRAEDDGAVRQYAYRYYAPLYCRLRYENGLFSVPVSSMATMLPL
jgi:hypothetical protein